MPASLWRRPVLRPRRRRAHARDEGFTLAEVIVSIMIMSIVMTSLTAVFVGGIQAASRQTGQQTAIQLAQDALDYARAIKGSALLTGRVKCPGYPPCATPPPKVAPYLNGLDEWDDPTSPTPQLPLSVDAGTVSGTHYTENYYVALCWQAPSGGDCLQVSPGLGSVLLYRTVVAVTWPDKHCANGTCSYVTSTLINSASDSPLFNLNQTAQPPVVNNPGDQTNDENAAVNLPLSATSGSPPITWKVTGLPPGLTWVPAGVISGTTGTSPGTYPVTVTATDMSGYTGTATFNWTIVPPSIPTPAAQASLLGAAVTPLQLTVIHDIGPYTWSATGPPPGLAINTSTGKISGTPTAVGSYTVVVTMTDPRNQTATTSFKWTVIAITLASPQNIVVGQNVSAQAWAYGGKAPYTWTATDLPVGLAIDKNTGVISGSADWGTRFLSTITVTDANGVSVSSVVVWNVDVTNSGTPQIWLGPTSPTCSSPSSPCASSDRTDSVGTDMSKLTAYAAGSNKFFTWSASGLPAGVSINPGTGQFAGAPSQAGTWVVTLTAVDDPDKKAYFMFTWTVQ